MGAIAATGRRNGLGEQTIKTLASCVRSSSATTFEHCEFLNAHDLLLNGPDVIFRENWVHNIDDDGTVLAENVYWQSQRNDDVGDPNEDFAFESRTSLPITPV